MEIVMDKIKNSLIVILFVTVIILLLLRGCSNPISKVEPKSKIKSIDTITITKLDTVVQIKEISKYVYISKPILTQLTESKTYNTINILSDP